MLYLKNKIWVFRPQDANESYVIPQRCKDTLNYLTSHALMPLNRYWGFIGMRWMLAACNITSGDVEKLLLGKVFR
jgi:hypothetical protein